MTNDNKNLMNSEQIKNESTKSLDLYRKFKTYLEKDEFGLFNLKAKKVLEEKVFVSEAKIRSLLNLKVKSEQVLKNLIEKRKSQIIQNKKLKESLVKKLDLEVEK